ncbi:hypothetical protein EBR96_01255 [bacterium]|nr:hypothetical protein [bacterium]
MSMKASQMQHEKNSLDDVLKLIPKTYLTPDWKRATLYLLTLIGMLIAFFGFSWSAWHFHWVVYPISWIILGTIFASFFFLGHDCAHYSFFPSRIANVVVGHVAMLTSAYPFYSWKFVHDAHHRHTNNRRIDPQSNDWDMAWYPFSTGQFQHLKRTSPLNAQFYWALRSFVVIGATFYNMRYNHNLPFFKPSQRKKVVISIVFSIVAQVGIMAAIWRITGSAFAVFHFWIFPILVCNAWISIHTFVQHTAEDTLFFEPSRWTPYNGQVKGTINCYFPKWLSFLHCNIDIHIPHHISTRVPSYYLRQVNRILLGSRYREDMRERRVTLPYLLRQIRTCRLWNTAERRFETM